MTAGHPHITVCICTFRRPALLRRLLINVVAQDTNGLFTYSVVVADNDPSRSAEPVVSELAETSSIPMLYCVEPQQNISLTRNRAIANATGSFIAFIDDDEFPIQCWLLTLFKAYCKYGADGVLGPVKCYFDETPPQWVIKGKFHERPTYPTGFVIDWTKGRTGNVLLKRDLFAGGDAFNPQFHRAGDQDFFRRMIEKGHVFIWCNEAVAYEVVPPMRWTRRFMVKRALLRGMIGMQHPATRVRRIAMALIAVPVYIIALPFFAVLGHHRFMKLLVGLCTHLSGLLTICGLPPVRSQLVTD